MKLFLPEEHGPGAGIRAGALPVHPLLQPPRLQQTLHSDPSCATDLALSASASPELSWSAAIW